MEIWRDIPSYEGFYQVSNLGNVKNLERKVKNKDSFRTVRERILKPAIDTDGYGIVSLSVRQKVRKRPVHLLVASAFLNHISNGTTRIVVDHINNIKKDNMLSNLQLISNRENSTKDQKGFYSKFIGVTYNSNDGFYRTSIRIYPDRIFLGQSKDEEYCSFIYNTALGEMDKYNGCKKTFRQYIKAKASSLKCVGR